MMAKGLTSLSGAVVCKEVLLRSGHADLPFFELSRYAPIRAAATGRILASLNRCNSIVNFCPRVSHTSQCESADVFTDNGSPTLKAFIRLRGLPADPVLHLIPHKLCKIPLLLFEPLRAGNPYIGLGLHLVALDVVGLGLRQVAH